MRKRAVVLISYQELETLLKLPDGIRAVAMTEDFFRSGLAIAVEGDSIPETPEGTTLPDLLDSDGNPFKAAFKTYQEGYQAGIDMMTQLAADSSAFIQQIDGEVLPED